MEEKRGRKGEGKRERMRENAREKEKRRREGRREKVIDAPRPCGAHVCVA